jgi:hypothetical protein
MSTDPKDDTTPATPWPGASPNKRNFLEDEQGVVPETITIQRTSVTVKVNPEAKPKP